MNKFLAILEIMTPREIVGVMMGLVMVMILIAALFLTIEFAHRNEAYYKSQMKFYQAEAALYYETSQEQTEAMQMQCVTPKSPAHHQLSSPLRRTR